jgi:hypothetical protein
MASDSTYKLMWRNVYPLPYNFDAVNFTISVRRVFLSGYGDTLNKIGNDYFSSILGLTDNNGFVHIGNTEMFDIDHRLLIIPPFLADSGFKNNEPFSNPKLGIMNTNHSIYYENGELFAEIMPKYSILMMVSSFN